MKLPDQVVSLELAKRLKKLGVKQESLFWYEQIKVAGLNQWSKDWSLGFNNNSAPYHKGERTVSAFTVAELGEMLPLYPVGYPLHYAMGGKCIVLYGDKTAADGKQIIHQTDANTEADARAKMLIYLLENNLITAPSHP